VIQPAPNISRRDQIAFHLRCVRAHAGRAWRHTRAMLWSVPGLVRAIFDL